MLSELIRERWSKVLLLDQFNICDPEPEVVRFLNLCKSRRFRKGLDIGCGSGRHLLSGIQAGFEMVGVDLTDTAVRQSNSLLAQRGTSAHLYRSCMTTLPFVDEAFDFVISCCVANHTDRSGFHSAISEAFRVLQRGGLFFLFVMSRQDPRFRRGRYLSEDCYLFTEGVETGIPHYFPSDADLSCLLGQAGQLVTFQERYYSNAQVFHPEARYSVHLETVTEKN